MLILQLTLDSWPEVRRARPRPNEREPLWSHVTSFF